MPIDSLLVVLVRLLPYIDAEGGQGRRGLAELHAALGRVVPALLDQRVAGVVPTAQRHTDPLEECGGFTEGATQVVHMGQGQAQVLDHGVIRRPRQGVREQVCGLRELAFLGKFRRSVDRLVECVVRQWPGRGGRLGRNWGVCRGEVGPATEGPGERPTRVQVSAIGRQQRQNTGRGALEGVREERLVDSLCGDSLFGLLRQHGSQQLLDLAGQIGTQDPDGRRLAVHVVPEVGTVV
jgi:hypothetical protein